MEIPNKDEANEEAIQKHRGANIGDLEKGIILYRGPLKELNSKGKEKYRIASNALLTGSSYLIDNEDCVNIASRIIEDDVRTRGYDGLVHMLKVVARCSDTPQGYVYLSYTGNPIQRKKSIFQRLLDLFDRKD